MGIFESLIRIRVCVFCVLIRFLNGLMNIMDDGGDGRWMKGVELGFCYGVWC